MRLFSVGLAALLLWVVPAARAQCTKDVECKGNRICVDGKCVDAPPGTVTTPPGAVFGGQPAAVTAPADPGWAMGAGVFGFVAGAVTLSLALGSELTADDPDVSIPLGGSATVALAISGPIVALGGASARDNPAVEGCPACRIIGWTTYGLTIVDAIVIIVLAVDDVVIPEGIPTSLGLLGLAALGDLALDAVMSSMQARKLAGGTRSAGAGFSPYAAPLRLPDGSTGASFGIVGRF